MTPLSRENLIQLLRWSMEIGADEIIDDHAHNWLSEDKVCSDFSFSSPDLSPQKNTPSLFFNQGTSASAHISREDQKNIILKENSKPSPLPTSFTSSEAISQSARDQLGNVKTLEELRKALIEFEGCALKKTAKNLCFFRGSSKANLMIVGEAPGRDEDVQGSPFVGRAGQLLDRMLAAIGLEEKDVHITNVVYWRPPGNRAPTSQETEVCRPFLEKQISLVSPLLLLLLGTSAAKQILQREDGILRLRGRWFETNINGCKIPTLASLHPAYLLRTPSAKKIVWRDLLLIKRELSKKRTV